MRTFIRHPSDIPIEVQFENAEAEKEKYLKDISTGGLSFKSDIMLDENAIIRVRIPLIKPVFEARARVVWCRPENGYYDTGVEFIETEDVFKIRMVEQICHIEHYKKEVQEKEGRVLSGREAALEWISKYANTFQTEILRSK
ncbi:MAG: hypothetical protein A2314_03115 [Elusimicrobia bacterium RIFOXYB2_FULL_50_12]|nr:MAG: hypothetical protein A2314_03115 [Elusimicrobia bacterium RIFOXYB2_FULL_50_12]